MILMKQPKLKPMLFRQSSAKPQKTLPVVRLDLVDMEQEKRDQRCMLSFYDEESRPPLGLEFEFQAFNDAGDAVCSGKITHIPNASVMVCGIKTVVEQQRKGYGTSTVLGLSKAFGGLPIVPVDERYDGLSFWPSIRERFAESGLVEMQTSVTDSNNLRVMIEKSGQSRNYTPSTALPLVKNGI
ncbi:MAG: hypothetical protein HGA71_08240 [Azonexaceae bacterium]|nr:hypothetical protein [Azonexaceae bacterium]